MGGEKRGNLAKKAAHAVLTNCVSYLGTPDIILADNDAMFVGKEFSQFCTYRNIPLHTVIPGHRQSLGDTGRRRRYFR